MSVGALASLAAIWLGTHAVAVKHETDQLQGTWRVLTNESIEGKLDEAYNRRDNYHVVIKGSIWGWRSNGAGNHDVAFKVDPTRTPKWLDLDIRAGKVHNKCLYELDGDDVRLFIGHFGRARPERTAIDPGISVLVLKRVKS